MHSSSNHRITLPPAFHRLAWSNLMAQSAEQISLAAAPLVAVFLLGASAAQTGLLQTAQTLPFLLLSLPMGVYADRHSRRGLMASAEAVRVLAMITILMLIGTHLLTLPLLAACGFIGAAGTVAYSVAAPSLVPSLVPRAALPAANGRIELARSVAYSAGPAIGGVIVGSVGAGWAYALATVLSAFAVALLRALPVSAHLPRTGRHFLAEVREGAAFVFRDPLLRPILLTAVFFNLGYFVLQAVYVAYAAHHLHMSSWVIGMSLAAYGSGMVAGALAGPEVSRRMSFGRTLVIGPVRLPGISADERNLVFSARMDGLLELLFARCRAGAVDNRINDVASGDHTSRHARQSVGHHEHSNLWSASRWRAAWRSPRDAERRERVPANVERGVRDPVRGDRSFF